MIWNIKQTKLAEVTIVSLADLATRKVLRSQGELGLLWSSRVYKLLHNNRVNFVYFG